MEGMRTLTECFPSFDSVFKEAGSVPEGVTWEGRPAEPEKDLIKQQFVTKERPLIVTAPGRPLPLGTTRSGATAWSEVVQPRSL